MASPTYYSNLSAASCLRCGCILPAYPGRCHCATLYAGDPTERPCSPTTDQRAPTVSPMVQRAQERPAYHAVVAATPDNMR